MTFSSKKSFKSISSKGLAKTHRCRRSLPTSRKQLRPTRPNIPRALSRLCFTIPTQRLKMLLDSKFKRSRELLTSCQSSKVSSILTSSSTFSQAMSDSILSLKVLLCRNFNSYGKSLSRTSRHSAKTL